MKRPKAELRDRRAEPRAVVGRAPRHGSLLVEALVATTILASAVAVIGPLAVCHDRLLQRCRHRQAALDELSNQLDRLTHMPASVLEAALAQLEPSEFARQALPSPELTFHRTPSADVVRLALTISWNGIPPERPMLTLAAWVDGRAEPDDRPLSPSEAPSEAPADATRNAQEATP